MKWIIQTLAVALVMAWLARRNRHTRRRTARPAAADLDLAPDGTSIEHYAG